jgi:hypothetical protein
MKTVTSKDGTTIAFDQSGQGPALVLVGGLFEQRAMASETAHLMYEPPYNDDAAARQAWRQYRGRLKETLAAGHHGDAVGLFMSLLGAPADQIEAMHQQPMWPMWEGIAPTMEYDAAALGDEAAVPVRRAATLAVPALVIDGGASFPFMNITAKALASAMPKGQHRTLEGQTHEVAAEVLGPVLAQFFKT